MITLELEGEMDTDTLKPLQEGELIHVKLTNKSRKRVTVSKILSRDQGNKEKEGEVIHL
jgi:copper(I)-binding protein